MVICALHFTNEKRCMQGTFISDTCKLQTTQSLRRQTPRNPAHSLLGVPNAVKVIKDARLECIAPVADTVVTHDKVGAIKCVEPIPCQDPKVAVCISTAIREVVQLLSIGPEVWIT